MKPLLDYIEGHTRVDLPPADGRITDDSIIVADQLVTAQDEPNPDLLRTLLLSFSHQINPLDHCLHDLDELAEMLKNVDLAIRLIALGVRLGLWVRPHPQYSVLFIVISVDNNGDIGFAKTPQSRLTSLPCLEAV